MSDRSSPCSPLSFLEPWPGVKNPPDFVAWHHPIPALLGKKIVKKKQTKKFLLVVLDLEHVALVDRVHVLEHHGHVVPQLVELRQRHLKLLHRVVRQRHLHQDRRPQRTVERASRDGHVHAPLKLVQ